MNADPKVIADLQTTCGFLATMVEQYRVDRFQLKGIDLKWLEHKVHKWYAVTEEHLEIFIERLIWFQTDPSYMVGQVATGGDTRTLLQRELTAANSAFTQLCQFRKNAWNIRADGVPDLYEHAVQAIEKQIVKMECQLKLINGLTQPAYVGARLEDD